MNLKNRTIIDHLRTQTVRVLSCVLLVGIVYSATFDAVHSHGISSGRLNPNINHSFNGQTGVVSEVPLPVRFDGQDCLICVLHRQFSCNVVHAPFFIAESAVLTAFSSASTVFHHLNTFSASPIARHSGRAPPQVHA